VRAVAQAKGGGLDVRLLFVPYLIRGAGDVALGLVVGCPEPC
jgi:hypothetical protein